MIRFYIILLFISIGIASCDCYVQIKGKIVSTTTGQPISGVIVKMVERKVETTSNANGQFLLDEQTGFCYDPKIELVKVGFKPFRLTVSHDSEETTYKTSSGSTSVDFDEPVASRIGTWISTYSSDFKIKGDSIIFYLDDDNPNEEIERIKERLRNGS
ncbi:MAG: carboxypeptidase-like regulatory domain-containing protein [Cyclobacteriaceae bacterium]